MAPKIAIIGAGPGGCMLARLLHLKSIPCTVFEGEESINCRSQGGTLDLRAKTGLPAMKEAGLYEEFLKLARYDGEALRFCDKKLTTWMKRSPSKQGQGNKLQEAPEIDRSQLRQMLMESIPKDAIRWNHRLKSVGEDLTLYFDNGRSEKGFDLIVGVDGAFSKVRNLLTSEKPFYVGLGGGALTIPDAANKAPEVYELVNRGSCFAYSDGKSLTGQQLGDGSINVGFCSHLPEDWRETCGYDPEDLPSMKKALKERYQDWDPRLTAFIDAAEGEVQTRNYYMLPIGFTWKHKAGVTLLGDAAHLMTPFAGIGVNLAFYDAMLLSHAIVEADKDGNLDAHIIEFEKKMWEHAHEGQKWTYGAMTDMLFTPGAPRTSVESYTCRFMKHEAPGWAYPFLVAIVYVGFGIYKLFV